MSLLQVNIDDKLKKAIQASAKKYNVPISSLVKIVLVKTFLDDNTLEGNIFNAKRDNNGKGIAIEKIIDML